MIIRNFYYDSTGPGTYILHVHVYIQVHYILHVHVLYHIRFISHVTCLNVYNPTHTHTHTCTHTHTHMLGVLCCFALFVCLACFFLPSFSSLIKTCTFLIQMYVHTPTHTHIHTPDVFLYWYPTGNDPPYTAANVQTVYRFGGGTTIPHPQSQT